MKIFKAKYIVQSGAKIFKDSLLLVENGKIIDVVQNSENCRSLESHEFTDFGNALITPGFTNFHTHLQYTNLNNNLPSKDFGDWIIHLMQNYARWSEEEKRNSFINGIKLSIQAGCSTIVQTAKIDSPQDFFILEELKNFSEDGGHACLFLEVFSNPYENKPKNINDIKKKFLAVREKYGHKIMIGLSPHSIYNVPKGLWREIAEFARAEDVLVHTHLAESSDEALWLNGKPNNIMKVHNFVGWNPCSKLCLNSTPFEYLKDTGIFKILGERLTLAHCVELSVNELEKLVDFGSKIAFCPMSNLFLHKKTVGFSELTQKIFKNSAIGTDSLFSNYSLNILKEANYIYKNSDCLSFSKIIDMLSLNPAKFLRMKNKTGSLQKGFQADFSVFSMGEKSYYKRVLDKDKPDFVYLKGVLCK